jgi:hypothetical protein
MPSSIFAVFIRPSDAVTVIIPSRTAKLPKTSVPLASRKLIFLGIGELLAAQIRRLPILPAPAMTVVQKVPSSN